MRRLILTTLLVSSFSGMLSSTASAQDDSSASTPEDPAVARAKQIYANGTRLYDEGQYAEAALAFEEAYKLSNAPPLLFNTANAYERMGDLDRAIAALNKYRVYADPSEQDALTRRVQNLEKRQVAEAAAAAPVVTEAAQDAADPVAAGANPSGKTGPSTPTVLGGALLGVGGLAAIVGGSVAGVTYARGNALVTDAGGAETEAEVAQLKADYDALRPMNQQMLVVTGVGVGVGVLGAALLAAGGGPKAADRSPVVPVVSADVSRTGARASLAWTF